ncbi:hypothetical protein E2C01_092617 [Portunus trituberculatus]|uniref:Uncharacterized protein n=1 Tax=Portunus trituberculatus TaxID=210409 RepID=A0A5B7JVX3_PORTR|nr:hypothetical protein [Portunus trituberculatus]
MFVLSFSHNPLFVSFYYILYFPSQFFLFLSSLSHSYPIHFLLISLYNFVSILFLFLTQSLPFRFCFLIFLTPPSSNTQTLSLPPSFLHLFPLFFSPPSYESIIYLAGRYRRSLSEVLAGFYRTIANLFQPSSSRDRHNFPLPSVDKTCCPRHLIFPFRSEMCSLKSYEKVVKV